LAAPGMGGPGPFRSMKRILTPNQALHLTRPATAVLGARSSPAPAGQVSWVEVVEAYPDDKYFHENQETEAMRCTACDSGLRTTTTDLPFKVDETTIVVLKGLPVAQCVQCPEYLIEDPVLRRVDEILARVEGGTELEVIRYAA
jgi:YgiT-type zinc finger domain-containing protein